MAENQTLTLSRNLDAPRDLVFQVWTDPAHLAQWWGPSGFTNPVCELDVRPGGAILIHMRGPDGTVYPMKGTFREVVAPERIVFASTAMEDADGNPAFEVLTTVDLEDAGSKTRISIRAEVLWSKPEASGALSGMEEGWNQTLARLAEYLLHR